MMIDLATLLTIIGMGLVTYFTRVCGFLLLRNKTLSAKQTRMMSIAPGCVFIAIIAPEFLTGTSGDILALCVTFLAAMRLGMLGTIIVGIVSGFGFNWLLS
jgi:uncharacterized membrane protein